MNARTLVWDNEILFGCALCGAELRVKYHGRTPAAFCRSCIQILARRRNEAWGRRHGEARTKLYSVWYQMRDRCGRANHQCFKDYGGRGIWVAKLWRESYVAFRDWARANGYADGLYLDRKDNDGPYTPENCQWVSNQINTQNTRTVKYRADVIAKIKGLLVLGKSYEEINAIYPLTHRHYRGLKNNERWQNIAPVFRYQYIRLTISGRGSRK